MNSKGMVLLNQINDIESTLKSIRYCDVIVNKYKYLSISFMEYVDKGVSYDSPLEINPLIIYKIINTNQLLVKNKTFESSIHDIYCDMMNKYISPEYYKKINEEYISTEAKIYKIYIFRITAEKKLNTFKSVQELNKEHESLLKKYILLIT